MPLSLLVDGNFIFNRIVHTLNKKNEMEYLPEALHAYVDKWVTQYPFASIYFFSDVSHYWRKEVHPEYKGTRKKKSDIDWAWAKELYQKGKDDLPKVSKRVKVYQSKRIEGDDWIAHTTAVNNKKGLSNLILASDADLYQLVKVNIQKATLNMIVKDSFGYEKAYLPHNRHYTLHKLQEKAAADLFSTTNYGEFLSYVAKIENEFQVHEIDHEEELFSKLISGDKSDNILSVYRKPNKNGKEIGIGDTGARKIYELYKEKYPDEIDFFSKEFINRVAPVVCQAKKDLNKEKIDWVKGNLKANLQLVHLHEQRFPQDVNEHLKAHIQ